MYELFTHRARNTMRLANHEAQRCGHIYLGSEHILLGVVVEAEGVAANALRNLDIDLHALRNDIKLVIDASAGAADKLSSAHAQRAKEVIEHAMEESHQLGHSHVGTEHLLLGLLRELDDPAVQVLINRGLTIDVVRAEIVTLHKGMSIEDAANRLPKWLAGRKASFVAPENTIGQARFKYEGFTGRARKVRDKADELHRSRKAMLDEWLAKRSISASSLSWSYWAVPKLALAIAEHKWWSLLPRLADWLEQAGCADSEILNHCRDATEHGSNCWVVDLLLARSAQIE